MTLAWMYANACSCDHGVALHRGPDHSGSCIALKCFCEKYVARASAKR